MSEARAEVSSSVPTKADNPLDSLDAEAQFAVRLAAEIGRQSNYVRYRQLHLSAGRAALHSIE